MYYVSSPDLGKNFKAKGKTILFPTPEMAAVFIENFMQYAICNKKNTYGKSI